MKNALVTGGAGFLGSHLCRRLLMDGYRVYALDNLYTGSKANIADMMSNPNFTFIEADVIEFGCQNTETQRGGCRNSVPLCLCVKKCPVGRNLQPRLPGLAGALSGAADLHDEDEHLRHLEHA